MLFSICTIMKNEANVLSRLSESLKNFLAEGGVWVCLDTGSTDNSAEVARSLGATVYEVGERFIKVIDTLTASKINKRFVFNNEALIVKGGDRLFDFAAARNHCASLAPADMVIAVDADEYFTKLDFNKINKLIEEGWQQFITPFIFARDTYGKPSIQFYQSRFYNKKTFTYEGIVHEIPVGQGKTMQLSDAIYMLEHQQELGKGHRSSYIVGLALDCYLHQNKDRQSHYFARELMYSGRYKSAIKEFERHTTMGGWKLEAAQSMIFIGDCYGFLNNPDKQAEWYHKSFHFDSNRREALLKLSAFYRHNDNIRACAAYAAAALELPYTEYYGNDMAHYRHYPHELLYWAKGWLGDIKGAQEHLLKAKDYQPASPTFARDTQYYFEYPDSYIEGWMPYKELLWLYETAKKFESIAEIGSWKGRSTHALLSGCKKGIVFSIDHFMGSVDPIETGHKDVFEDFRKNVGHFKNLQIIRDYSVNASKRFDNGFLEMVFLDGGHQYHEVIADINAWLPKCSMLICGHDYEDWEDVKKAVDEIFGKPDEIIGNIWVVYLDKRNLTTEFTRKIKYKENFSFVKKGDGELHCMNNHEGHNCDGIKYEPILGEKLKNTFAYLDLADNVFIPKFNNQRYYNCLLHRIDSNLSEVTQFYKTIINSDRKKIYIAPKKLSKVVRMLGATHYIVPDTIDISQYDLLVEDIKKFVEKDSILMFSCGLFAKPFIHECILKNPEITCLDLGSAFDPFVGTSRTHQLSKEKMMSLYKDFIPDDLPTVSIILPTLGREEGLKRCLASIDKLNYPKELIETIVIKDEPRIGVPLRVKEGYEKSKGEYICYAANDIEFTPSSLTLAVKDAIKHKKRLVTFETGVRNPEGYTCEHFIIHRSLVEELGEIFDTRFGHSLVDDLLWHKADRLNETYQSEGYVHHYHYSRIGSGIPMDEINWLIGDSIEPDRKLYKEEIQKLRKDTVRFKRERIINRLALPITRGCNRRCPECTAVERKGFPANPISIEELENVGNLLGPIEKIEITGGEPSFHPQFKEISEKLHTMFQCKDIMLLTNGWAFSKDENLPILLNYDKVYITHYTDNFAQLYGEKPNTHLVEKLKNYLKDYPNIQFWPQTMDWHNPIKIPTSWIGGCIYDYDKGDMISYFEGQLYGCCTSWQLDFRGKGIPLTKDWRDHLGEIELPCSQCFLGRSE